VIRIVDLASKAVLRNWHDIEFHDFLEARIPMLDIERGGGAAGDAVVLATKYAQ
jgi:hypothetical protein